MNERNNHRSDYAPIMLDTLVEGSDQATFARALEAHDLAAVFDELGMRTEASGMRQQALQQLDQAS
ncbi:MAG: hypothetical protein JWN95_3633 [Frankiales bacterium]|nr:hypothetical protein [Frankiales bacterium]